MIKPYECTQCGATDFNEAGQSRVRCAYCHSLFQVTTRQPTLMIKKGARVVFGRNANVEVRGDVDIEPGAQVDIQGKVSVVKGGRKQEFHLELIR